MPVEPGRTEGAAIVLHTIVGLHMPGVSVHITKCGAALFTLADHFPCVDALVGRQVTTLGERLPADVTHERPESTVCPAVFRQSIPPFKRLATVVTAERPLIRVCSVMTSHMACKVCGELAPLTLVFPVPADVAVTLLHVLVHTILSYTCVVAVDAVEHAFARGRRARRRGGRGHPERLHHIDVFLPNVGLSVDVQQLRALHKGLTRPLHPKQGGILKWYDRCCNRKHRGIISDIPASIVHN